MFLPLLFIAITFAAAFIAPKAFSWLLLGPVIGIPLGITAWTIAIQFFDQLFNAESVSIFAVVGALVSGFAFSRGK